MKKLIFITLSIIVFSCENKTKDTITKDRTEPQKNFVVNIKFKTNKVGEIKLALYNIVPNTSQNVWIQINEEVVATTTLDNVTANFGENISNSFRIGFDNKIERKFEFEWIRISYGKREIEIYPEDLTQYFTRNEFIVQNPISLELETKKINGKYNPLLFLKKEYLIDLRQE